MEFVIPTGKKTLDFIDNIQLDQDNPPMSNYHAIHYLSEGLHFLANTVKNMEVQVQNHPIYKHMVFGFDMLDPNVNLNACFTHWFGVSLSNYVRLIGLFGVLEKNNWTSEDVKDNSRVIKAECTNYVKSVIPEIYLWRNKVAAHFAITDPFPTDNLATLEMSLINPITFSGGRYYAGEMQWSTMGELSELPKWSITEVFERLIPRYWPDLNNPSESI